MRSEAAISQPMKPEPTTTTGARSVRRACSRRRSSRLRSTCTAGSSAPGPAAGSAPPPSRARSARTRARRRPATVTVRSRASSAAAVSPISRTSLAAEPARRRRAGARPPRSRRGAAPWRAAGGCTASAAPRRDGDAPPPAGLAVPLGGGEPGGTAARRRPARSSALEGVEEVLRPPLLDRAQPRARAQPAVHVLRVERTLWSAGRQWTATSRPLHSSASRPSVRSSCSASR